MKLPLETITYRSKQVGTTHLIWLERLNRFIQFEEPAFTVFNHMTGGVSTSETVKQIAEKYRIPAEKARHFVADIHQKFEQLHTSFCEPQDPSIPLSEMPGHTGSTIVKTIVVEGKRIRISFGDSTLVSRIYPMFSHLESSFSDDITQLYLEVFRREQRLYLKVNMQEGYTWGLRELHRLKGELYMQIINLIHDKVRDNWMGVIHASSVFREGQAIMFPARPGKGKSTLAALLIAHGCSLVSDDFTPLAAADGRIYPFPGSISVKPGSLPVLGPYFPELSLSFTKQNSGPHENPAWITPRSRKGMANHGLQVRGIIFVNYDEQHGCDLVPADPLSGFNELLGESWLATDGSKAEQFMDWFFTVPCYSLNYGNSKKAVESLLILMDDVP
jgi:hypothetical protein